MLSYSIISYRILYYHIVYYRMLSYLILSYLILSKRILSYRMLSYRILSYCNLSKARYIVLIFDLFFRLKTMKDPDCHLRMLDPNSFKFHRNLKKATVCRYFKNNKISFWQKGDICRLFIFFSPKKSKRRQYVGIFLQKLNFIGTVPRFKIIEQTRFFQK